MKNTKLSIIVSIFSEKGLERCLSSLVNQSLDDMEIFLLDDGFSADTQNIMKFYEEKYNFISSFRCNKRKFCYNDVISKAKGEYVFLINSSDWIEKDALKNYLDNALKHDSDVVLFNVDDNSEKSFSKEKAIYNQANEYAVESNQKEKNLKEVLFASNVNFWSKMYKKSFLIKNNIRFSDEKNLYDYTIHFKSLIYSKRISCIPKPLYHKGNSGNNTAKINYSVLIDNFLEIKSLLVKLEKFSLFEKEYIILVLTLTRNYFDSSSDNTIYQQFESIKEFFINQNFSGEILKEIPFDLYKFYVHTSISGSYLEYCYLEKDESENHTFVENILFEQLNEKNKLITDYEFKINDLEYYKKILLNISNEFDKKHFLNEKDYEKITEMALFDEDFYKYTYGYNYDIHPFLHYLYMGHSEGKNPCEKFDGNFYENFNENVSKFEYNPLLYFVQRGMNEGITKINKNIWQPTHINKYELDEEIRTFDKSGVTKDKRNTEVIVSLTSFPERMYDIHYCIYSLLNQKLKPDRVVLWLAQEEFPNGEYDIPANVLNLKKFGLEIKFCKNLMSFKKIIPALREFPDAIIVTADDDIYYADDWLELLYDNHKLYPKDIILHRSRKIAFDEKFNVKEYDKWTLINEDTMPSYYHLINGGGGALYPPHSLDDTVFNEKVFMGEYSTTDDIWLWAMAVLYGTKIKTIKNDYNDFTPVNPARLLGLTDELTLYNSANKYGKNLENMRKILKQYPLLIKKLKEE